MYPISGATLRSTQATWWRDIRERRDELDRGESNRAELTSKRGTGAGISGGGIPRGGHPGSAGQSCRPWLTAWGERGWKHHISFSCSGLSPPGPRGTERRPLAPTTRDDNGIVLGGSSQSRLPLGPPLSEDRRPYYGRWGTARSAGQPRHMAPAVATMALAAGVMYRPSGTRRPVPAYWHSCAKKPSFALPPTAVLPGRPTHVCSSLGASGAGLT